MWSTWFQRFKTQLSAVTSAEAVEIKTARLLAFADERLQNNVLLAAASDRTARVDHGSAPVLGVVRRSCSAH